MSYFNNPILIYTDKINLKMNEILMKFYSVKNLYF